MSGEDSNSNSNNDMASIIEMMKVMNSNINNNINSFKEDIAVSMSHLREDLNSNISQSSEQLHMRMEVLQEKIISRANSRATSRAASRAVSPTTLAAKLNVKLRGDPVKKDASSLVPETPRAYAPPEGITRTAIVKGNDNADAVAEESLMLATRLNAKVKEEPFDLVMDTPRAYAPEDEISMTAIIKNNEDAERFSQANPLAKQRKPLVTKRMNTHAFRDSLAATSRKNNPTQRGTFSATTPEVTAYLDGPLTLSKCLEFERLLLEYSQRYNIEIRYTNQVSNNLKYEIRARFELTDSQFYDLDQQQLSILLSEMIAPVTKAEFLKILKETVTFTGLPHNYVPTEQNLQTFLQQLLVYKDRLYRAIEFLLLFEGSEDSLPTCDNKPLGLLKLISDTVPHGYIKNLIESDGPLQKYKDVYEFFKRVAVKSVEFDSLAKAARKFSTAFGGPEFLSSERNHQRFLTGECST